MRAELAKLAEAISQHEQYFVNWQETLNTKVTEPEVNRQKSREQKPSDLFELATELGKERAVEDRGKREFSDDLLAHYIHDRVASIKLDTDAQNQLNAILQAQHLYRMDFTTEPDFRIAFTPNDGPEAFQLYREAITNFLAGHKDVFDSISVSDYLKWFYESVPYSTAESSISRNSPIDPLRQLRYRAQSPFLNIDQSQLGTEHGFDTEPVRLLGASPLPKTEQLVNGQHPLDEFGGDSYDMIDTGMPNRLDVLHARFGYKVDDLANLKDYYKSYRYFTETLGDPLHIHRDWPTGMNNLVRGSSAGTAPQARARLRVIGDMFSHARGSGVTGAEAITRRTIDLQNGTSWSVSIIADDLDAPNDDISRQWLRSFSDTLESALRTGNSGGTKQEKQRDAFVTARDRATEDINRLTRQLGRPERRMAYAIVIIDDDHALAAAVNGDTIRLYAPDGTSEALSGDGSIVLRQIPVNSNIVLVSDGIGAVGLENAVAQAVERYRTDPSRITDAVVAELRGRTLAQDVSLIAIRLIEA
jgi:hypothetical protein